MLRDFNSISGLQNVIGAIDGCHIRISRPRKHGDDYINRKGHYSILLQGTCDHNGNFRDIYVGPAGRVHDARMLRCSPIFQQAILANSGSFLETVLTLAATFHLLLPVIF